MSESKNTRTRNGGQKSFPYNDSMALLARILVVAGVLVAGMAALLPRLKRT